MTFRPRRWMAIALSVLATLVVFVWAFDANWIRPAIERHLTEKSGRSVHFDDMKVSLDRHFDLQVRLRGVAIANAPWADTRDPMAAVGEARFAMSLRSLWERRPVVSRLVLVDGRLDLERQPDGLRNWRLTHPDDRGPGHVVIDSVEAQRTSLRFVHRGIELDMTASAAPNADAERPTSITFLGRYHGERFGGEVATGPEVTLRDTGRSFALRGRMNAAGSHLQVDGRAADITRRTSLDGHVHVEGPSLVQLRKFLNAPLPESKPFTIDADLKKAATEYTFAKITARIGQTPLTGQLAYDVRRGRSWIEATLRGDNAQWDDLASLTTSGTARSGGKQPSTPSDHEHRSLNLERLDRIDGRFDLAIDRLIVAKLPEPVGIRVKATIDAGRLDVSDFDISLAEGHATGTLSLDTRDKLPAAKLALAWRGLRVGDLLRTAETKRVTGIAEGRVDLQAEGDSIAALAASLRGQATAHLRQGSLAKRLDAELGLDGAHFVGSWLSSDQAVPLRCAAVAFDVKNGLARARVIAIDTATTQIGGQGTVDLRDASVALTLTPRARRPGLLTLDRSIAVTGALSTPKVRLVDRVEPEAEAASCGPA